VLERKEKFGLLRGSLVQHRSEKDSALSSPRLGDTLREADLLKVLRKAGSKDLSKRATRIKNLLGLHDPKPDLLVRKPVGR
jgi:hypothetical protein